MKERLFGVADKIKTLTNWQPKYNLQEGLKHTIEWFSKPENLKQIFIMFKQTVDFN